jgi:hypothetical protein
MPVAQVPDRLSPSCFPNGERSQNNDPALSKKICRMTFLRHPGRSNYSKRLLETVKTTENVTAK